MGGSLRRSKKTRAKVSIRVRRKPKTRSKKPEDLKKAAIADQEKLGLSTWDDQKTYDANYRQAGLVPDANATFGRNTRPDALKASH